MNQFLESLEPLHGNLGPLVFQFEYLNKQKMPGAVEFMDQLGTFIEQLPADFTYCVELRNPTWINKRYFDFLAEKRLHHVFLQGYYMPSIFELYSKFRELIQKATVIRLHGPDRKAIEDQTGKDWSQIVASKDKDIDSLVAMVTYLQTNKVDSFVYVNNHFEGSAPRTIGKINHLLPMRIYKR